MRQCKKKTHRCGQEKTKGKHKQASALILVDQDTDAHKDEKKRREAGGCRSCRVSYMNLKSTCGWLGCCHSVPSHAAPKITQLRCRACHEGPLSAVTHREVVHAGGHQHLREARKTLQNSFSKQRHSRENKLASKRDQPCRVTATTARRRRRRRRGRGRIPRVVEAREAIEAGKLRRAP